MHGQLYLSLAKLKSPAAVTSAVERRTVPPAQRVWSQFVGLENHFELIEMVEVSLGFLWYIVPATVRLLSRPEMLHSCVVEARSSPPCYEAHPSR